MTVILASLAIGLIFFFQDRNPPAGQLIWEAPGRNRSSDYILLTPFPGFQKNQRISSLLLDTKGRVVRYWELERPAISTKLDSQGRLFSLLLTPPGEKRTPINGECNLITVMDSSQREVHRIHKEGLSHDFDFMPENRIAVLSYERVKLPSKSVFKDREFAFSDKLIVLNWQGEVEWQWSPFENIEHLSFDFGLSPPQISLTHGNSIQYISANPISGKPAFLLSFRNINLLVLVEYPSGRILWQNRVLKFSRQHDATFTSGHHILVFDNGLNEYPNMKVIEFDLNTEEIKWTWKPQGSYVTTSTMGGVRKLSNGSYLISNSNSGHLLEVNPNGDIVWSFLISRMNHREKWNWVLGESFYRAEVYPDSHIQNLLKQ